jgi:hypothetical protein
VNINEQLERAEWVPAQRHAGENLSDEPIEFIVVVPKVSAAPAIDGHPQY